MNSATRVLVLSESGSTSYVLPNGTHAEIGRHPDCEIVLPIRSVSRRHARLTAVATDDGGLATIEDIGGRAGVRIRGHRIEPDLAVPVYPGDVVEICGEMLIVHVKDEADAPSPGPFARVSTHRSASDDGWEETPSLVDTVAASELAVVIVGEAGVGKSFAAQAIHGHSSRSDGPFVRVDCASVSAAVLEHDLFGTDQGGISSPGLLETAVGGVVLLHDVDELPSPLQQRILEAVVKGRVLRRGGTATRPIDVRFIATSRRDLITKSASGAFSLPLLRALSGIMLEIPPLRERGAEIPGLARTFLAEAAERAGRISSHRLSSEALGVLVRHPFRGNIRELKKVMDTAFQLSGPRFVGPEHLVFDGIARTASSDGERASVQPSTRRFAPISRTEPPSTATEEIPVVVMPPAARRPEIPAPPPRPQPQPPKKRR